MENLTDGFSCIELKGFLDNCKDGTGTSVDQIKQRIANFRYGETENYWAEIDAAALAHAEELIRSRIIGQDRAIEKAMQSLYRATSPLSISSSEATNSKPRGVLFLAGPTGTGKIEQACAYRQSAGSRIPHRC